MKWSMAMSSMPAQASSSGMRFSWAVSTGICASARTDSSGQTCPRAASSERAQGTRASSRRPAAARPDGVSGTHSTGSPRACCTRSWKQGGTSSRAPGGVSPRSTWNGPDPGDRGGQPGSPPGAGSCTSAPRLHTGFSTISTPSFDVITATHAGRAQGVEASRVTRSVRKPGGSSGFPRDESGGFLNVRKRWSHREHPGVEHVHCRGQVFAGFPRGFEVHETPAQSGFRVDPRGFARYALHSCDSRVR